MGVDFSNEKRFSSFPEKPNSFQPKQTTMKKPEKAYTVSRIRQIQKERGPDCTCKPPSLPNAIRREAISGKLKFRPVAVVQEEIADQILKGSEKYSDGISAVKLEELFVEPDSYRVARRAYEDSLKAIKDARTRWDSQFDELVDQVNLNKFEDGEAAIKAAMLIK